MATTPLVTRLSVIPFKRLPFICPPCLAVLHHYLILENRPMQSKKKKRRHTHPQVINPHAAGIDCGASAHYVAVPPSMSEEPVRRFSSFTHDLHALADWLTECGVETVAMESTGVYWVALYDLLEARGFEVVLVNARAVKHVPGRKSDVADCQWLQQLHSFGLLRGSFRPSADIVRLRTYLRHREKLVRLAGDQVRRMQKSLVEMNLHLHNVISDITGVTGLAIVRDIVAGDTDPRHLARHRDRRCRASHAEIEAALTGHYRPEHVFVLGQHLSLFDAVQSQLHACDEAMEALLNELAVALDTPSQPLGPPRTRFRAQQNIPRFEIRPVLHRLTGGADLTQIHAIAPYTALCLIGEIGTDMSRWPTEKHFTSWLAVSPNNKISGDRILSSTTRRSANRASALLRMAAVNVGRMDTALGAHYRRLAFRVGKAKAVTATARKLAVLIYRVLKGDFAYHDPGADAYDDQHRQRTLRTLDALKS